MTAHTLMAKLQPFKGKKLNDCIDAISALAKGYRVNVMDPEVNTGSIDNESDRLNVKTRGGVITAFTVG